MWFSAPFYTPRNEHAGVSPMTVPMRRVAEKNPFHWRVGSAVLLGRTICSCQSSTHCETENLRGLGDVKLIQKGTCDTTNPSEFPISLMHS